MIDLMIYLTRIVNSCIQCIETFLEYIWYLPILGTTLGNLIFSIIILFMAIKLFERWIYSNKNNESSKKTTSTTAADEQFNALKKARKERKNNK